MNLRYLLSAVLLVVAAFASSKAAPRIGAVPQAKAQNAQDATKKQAPATQGAVHGDEGQRIFDQNCSRCHTAPDGFSPRISGTVVRHMRVRASLSQHDEQELLRFLNP
jgi:cytochrome c5